MTAALVDEDRDAALQTATNLVASVVSFLASATFEEVQGVMCY